MLEYWLNTLIQTGEEKSKTQLEYILQRDFHEIGPLKKPPPRICKIHKALLALKNPEKSWRILYSRVIELAFRAMRRRLVIANTAFVS